MALQQIKESQLVMSFLFFFKKSHMYKRINGTPLVLYDSDLKLRRTSLFSCTHKEVTRPCVISFTPAKHIKSALFLCDKVVTLHITAKFIGVGKLVDRKHTQCTKFGAQSTKLPIISELNLCYMLAHFCISWPSASSFKL